MSLFKKKEESEKTDLAKRFDLITRVGQGSMSRVWKADDAINGRFVAVKVLDKEKTARFESRFKGLNKPHEGDIAVSLKHPNIVRTYEIGLTLEDEMFLVMEYVEGSGLSLLVDLQSDRMKRYRTRFMIQIGEALSHFHEQHWIHRDICPRNIMVTEENEIKLIDFGLTVPDTPDFRKPGNRTGTANYMAPELIKRQPTDQRIDVFSYAVTCYEMYTKRHPWDAAMTIDAVLQHINKPPVQLTSLVPKVDSQIADTIMKGLEANPADRWQNIQDMVTEFRDAEIRLVKTTRKLMAARKKSETASGNGADSVEMNAVPKSTADAPVEKTTAEKSDKPDSGNGAAPKPPAAAGKKKRRQKKNESADDLALAALQGDDSAEESAAESAPADESGPAAETPADSSPPSEDEPLPSTDFGEDEEPLSLD